MYYGLNVFINVMISSRIINIKMLIISEKGRLRSIIVFQHRGVSHGQVRVSSTLYRGPSFVLNTGKLVSMLCSESPLDRWNTDLISPLEMIC